MKILYATAAALALASTVDCASAAPLAPLKPMSPIVLVAGGCGFAFHRNPFGACVPNRAFVYGPPVVRLPPPCPRGYHRDPNPARPICYPNF